jgi:protein-L-isoaspartate(D-aspartate) O-methyltransferase
MADSPLDACVGPCHHSGSAMRRFTRAVFALVLLAPAAFSDDFADQRNLMVRTQIAARGIKDKLVLDAMRSVERHRFVPADLAADAYSDHPLPIGEGQTISQPYIVALMTELLGLSGGERVLEIGTGSGYQAAVLARIVKEVFTIEIKPKLYDAASTALAAMGFANVHARSGDGYYGWPDQAPFDCIMITAAVDHVPQPLLQQLAPGGRMVLPLGDPFSVQSLVLVTKEKGAPTVKVITGVLFVPMTGKGATDGL